MIVFGVMGEGAPGYKYDLSHFDSPMGEDPEDEINETEPIEVSGDIVVLPAGTVDKRIDSGKITKNTPLRAVKKEK